MSFGVKISVSLPQVKQASKRWIASIERAQRLHTVTKLRGIFKQTVYGWSKKPYFDYDQETTSDRVTIRMFPTGDMASIYNMLDEGAKAHPIYPVRAKVLKFKPGYRSATTPGTLQSRRAYRSGSYQFSTKISMHPGFAARNFYEMVANEFVDQGFAMDMQAAVTEAARGN